MAMDDLIEQGANKSLPEGLRVGAIERLSDANVEDGIRFEILISGVVPMSDESFSNEESMRTQTWRAILSPNLAREIAGRLYAAAGGIDKSGEAYCPMCLRPLPQ